MSAFSTSQVRHLYVANSYGSSVAVGDAVGKIAAIANAAKTNLYFNYVGSVGLTRSDLIDISKITYSKAVDADSMAYKQKKYKLTLDTTVNSGSPISGQDYVLRVLFKNFVGLSEEDQYFKYGVVRGYTGQTASDFYKAMALSLLANFSRETTNLLNFYLETGGTDPAVAATLVQVTDKNQTLSGTYTGIVIEESVQPWILGTFQQTNVNFTLLPTTVTYSSNDLIWGVVKSVTSTNTIINGKKTADLEYFTLGERGDQYRYISFPNVFRPTYLVDPTLKYNYLELSYHKSGEAEDVQKSPITLTLVIPKIGATNSVSNVLTNTVISAINTAAGKTLFTALDLSS